MTFYEYLAYVQQHVQNAYGIRLCEHDKEYALTHLYRPHMTREDAQEVAKWLIISL